MEGVGYAKQLVANSSTHLVEQTLKGLPRSGMLEEFMGDRFSNAPNQNMGLKTVQFEQPPSHKPELSMEGHLEPSKIISNYGVKDYEPPFARPYEKLVGNVPDTFVSKKQLQLALAGLSLPNIQLPKHQVLDTYPIIQDLSTEDKSNPFQASAFAAPVALKLDQAIPGAQVAISSVQQSIMTEPKFNIQPVQSTLDFTVISDQLLKRNIRKLWERTLQISKLLNDLHDHGSKLPGPNSNTDRSIKLYIANIETQEDKVTELMGAFSEKLATDMGGSLAF